MSLWLERRGALGRWPTCIWLQTTSPGPIAYGPLACMRGTLGRSGQLAHGLCPEAMGCSYEDSLVSLYGGCCDPILFIAALVSRCWVQHIQLVLHMRFCFACKRAGRYRFMLESSWRL